MWEMRVKRAQCGGTTVLTRPLREGRKNEERRAGSERFAQLPNLVRVCVCVKARSPVAAHCVRFTEPCWGGRGDTGNRRRYAVVVRAPLA